MIVFGWVDMLRLRSPAATIKKIIHFLGKSNGEWKKAQREIDERASKVLDFFINFQ